MNKKNCILIVCILIGMSLLLLAEIKTNFTHQERDESIASPVSVDKAASTLSIEIPDTWKEDIDQHNRIDAEITVPERIRENGFQSVTAEIKDVNQEGTLALLETYYHPQKGEEDDQVIQYVGEDNMYLYFFKTGGASLSSTFRDYVSMAYREEFTEDYNRDLYPVNVELENFSLRECESKISDFCQSVGISGEMNLTYRALDYRTMEDEAEELHPDGTRTKPDYQWTVDDNSYYCTISQACNGLSIVPNYYLTSYADILNVGGHTCLLNKEKIVSFYINNIYDIQYEDRYEKLMEFSDVLEKYREYVGIAKQDYETVVTDISMIAVVVNQGDREYQIIPVWVFFGYWEEMTENVRGDHAVFINAVTGERL